ncbi:C40 family peptidase [Weeksellaceae bacterium TAE3-ERU29]|nr:C40 family peptidase [Weeksellaceae bacterium TAE3-ERU29]
MKKVIKFPLLLGILLIITSCGTTTNYLSQNTQTITTPKYKNKLSKIKISLKKPVIDYNKVESILDDQKEEVLEELSNATFVSYFDLTINKLIQEAESYIGTPYRLGGTSRSGIDCSAFMQRIYEIEGIDLPRVSRSQASIGIPVSRGELQRGDLIFFSTTSRSRVTHVGMVYDVTDDGQVSFIHASSSRGVVVSSLEESYWAKRFRVARRIDEFAYPQLVKS